MPSLSLFGRRDFRLFFRLACQLCFGNNWVVSFLFWHFDPEPSPEGLEKKGISYSNTVSAHTYLVLSWFKNAAKTPQALTR